MSPKNLKIALAVSVALNLFAVAAGTTLFINREHVERRLADQSRPNRAPPLATILQDLSPEVRERVQDNRRASALAADPDLQEARLKRRQAVELAAAPDFDRARVATLLEEALQAELRGRSRLRADAVELLASLEPADRKVAAPILVSRPGRPDRGDRKGGAEPKQRP